MYVVFRADASAQIGTGHVVRCLTLANKLHAGGHHAAFICRELPHYLQQELSRQGFAVHLISAPPPPLSHSGHDWELDAEETQAIIRGLPSRPDWLVVDHYGLDVSWERYIQPVVNKIMVIDDLADRPHMCDLLLDQNYYTNARERYEGLVSSHTDILLGPKFALLRDEFQADEPEREHNGRLRRVMVSFGGSDPTDETTKIIDAIRSVADLKLDFEIILGAANPRAESIRTSAASVAKVQCVAHVQDMATRMREADLFIGAGGSTTWERCRTGLPSLVISIAENQVAMCEDLASAGLILYVGRSTEVNSEVVASAIRTLCHSPWLVRHLARVSRTLVDGKGTDRVIQALSPRKIEVRRAAMQDCEMVFRWRNSESTRRHIFDRQPIPWERHEKWYHASLSRQDRVLLIGSHAGEDAGVLRYDINDTTAVISIYLNPAKLGLGLAAPLLDAGSRWLRTNRPEVSKIEAQILPENTPSQRAFIRAGFKLDHHVYKKVMNHDQTD